MKLDLLDKVAFVAGSSRGIGKAIAAQLLEEGCRVCISGRDQASLGATVDEFNQQFEPSRLMSAESDLTQVAAIEDAIRSIVSRWGSLDILIANIGTGSGKPGWDQDEAEWSRLFQLNFWGSVRMAQAAIPLMSVQGNGSIIFISSIAGVEASPAPLPYSAAKAALINYSKNLARTVAPLGIRVNCVAPGNILFPGGSWERHLSTRREATENHIAQEVPLRRFGTPEEIANFVVMLCSSRAAFAAGACLVIDGGQTRSL